MGNQWETDKNRWKSNQKHWKTTKTSGESMENQRNHIKTHRIPMGCKENQRILSQSLRESLNQVLHCSDIRMKHGFLLEATCTGKVSYFWSNPLPFRSNAGPFQSIVDARACYNGPLTTPQTQKNAGSWASSRHLLHYQPASKIRVQRFAIHEDTLFLYGRVQKWVGGGWQLGHGDTKKMLYLRKIHFLL